MSPLDMLPARRLDIIDYSFDMRLVYRIGQPVDKAQHRHFANLGSAPQFHVSGRIPAEADTAVDDSDAFFL